MLDGATNHTVSSGGVNLAVTEAGNHEGPTLVFVHGYPDTRQLWRPVFERLAGEFHLVAYDVRGSGESGAPRGPIPYRIERLIDDFEAVCQAVVGRREVHLIGHDWGGVQGWEFAAAPRLEGRIRSFTSIAGPALSHVLVATREPLRRGRPLRALDRMRRSWYVAPLCLPGGPTLAWSLLGGKRWRTLLQLAEHVPVDDQFPSSNVARHGRRGANLYRANIPARAVRGTRMDPVSVPVQLIIPSGDRFISESYYGAAELVAPRVRRRRVAGSHWAPRTQPDLVARWVAEFTREAEEDRVPERTPWRRGAGLEQLSGRLALVTGAGSGIGLACAKALAEHGARVILVDRDESALARAGEGVSNSRSLACDVSDIAALTRVRDEVLHSEGVPDVVLNNAGIGIAGTLLDTGAEEWQDIVGVNLMGVAHGSRLFGQAMVERGEGGQIVNTASAAAFMPTRALGAYSATKAAVLMLSQCLRAELRGYGIGVTAICPGVINTNITRSTRYVGRSPADQERMGDYTSRIYARRNFTAERVAEAVMRAIGEDRAVAPIAPEAKAMELLGRLAPRLARRVGAHDGLPV